MSLINWESTTRPKKFGVIGIKKRHHINIVGLSKMVWRMTKENDKLWSKVLLKIYTDPDQLRAIQKSPCRKKQVPLITRPQKLG